MKPEAFSQAMVYEMPVASMSAAAAFTYLLTGTQFIFGKTVIDFPAVFNGEAHGEIYYTALTSS